MKKPSNYYCHRAIENIASEKSGQNNLQVVEKIGQGSFGQVYKVFDPTTSQLLVLKHSKETDDATIKEEVHIMKELSNSEGFKRLTENSKMLGQSIIMNCLGRSLGTIMKSRGKMNVFSMKKIALQLIQKLEEFHSHKYVHRDLKPDNILLGDKLDSHSVYLIDFGLVTPFRAKASKRRRLYKGLVGTAKFSSMAAHEGFEQFPKDDLESLGYILLFFVSGRLPWDKEQSNSDEELFRKILKVKRQASIQDLCGGYNCLRTFTNKIRDLEFNQKVNYSELKAIFATGPHTETYCFDFCEDCWVQKAEKGNKVVEQEPRANPIRVSIME